LRLKIFTKLKTASFDSEFTGSYQGRRQENFQGANEKTTEK